MSEKVMTPQEWLDDLELAESYSGPAPEGDGCRVYKRDVIAPMMKALIEKEGGCSHHGHPELSRHDLELLECVTVWIDTARKHGGPAYENFVPSEVDYIKSRLFWRIRSGKKPLPTPPPCSFSCPWYEVVEEDRPHWCGEAFVSQYEKGQLNICQTGYKIEETVCDEEFKEEWVVSFNVYRFRVWRQELTNEQRKTMGNMAYGYCIQIIKNEGKDGGE